MHHGPITAFQIATQRHDAELRDAEHRRFVRRASAASPGRIRRRWFAGAAGRASAVRPVGAEPVVELRHAC
jgi:hypothetical protein